MLSIILEAVSNSVKFFFKKNKFTLNPCGRAKHFHTKVFIFKYLRIKWDFSQKPVLRKIFSKKSIITIHIVKIAKVHEPLMLKLENTRAPIVKMTNVYESLTGHSWGSSVLMTRPPVPYLDMTARISSPRRPYGSEARGTAGPDSNIDVLVMPEGPVDYGRHLKTEIKTLYPLLLQIGRPISPTPVAAC